MIQLNCSNAEGQTVLIIKDKEGYIYGGYASQPWERHADFYGDTKSFLLRLYPKASIFKPTGANNNVQWLREGQTFICITFGSPCLSKANRIFPEVIECWGIVQNAAKKEKHDAVKGTVLERLKEDRHMLNMVGLANSSE